jgi:hypothetical protein
VFDVASFFVCDIKRFNLVVFDWEVLGSVCTVFLVEYRKCAKISVKRNFGWNF